MEVVDEQEIIAALKQGRTEAYQLLVHSFSGKIYNLVFSILQNAQDAEDVSQEVFTTVYLSIGQFKGESRLSTWMYRIAVNKCQEQIRKRSRKKRFAWLTGLNQAEEIVSMPFMHPGIELENKERAAILMRAIAVLPENQRIAFTMHKLEGISYEEIGQIMKVSLSSVESLIFRATRNLREKLRDYYEKNER